MNFAKGISGSTSIFPEVLLLYVVKLKIEVRLDFSLILGLLPRPQAVVRHYDFVCKERTKLYTFVDFVKVIFDIIACHNLNSISKTG